MLGVCLVEILHVDLEPFAGERIHFMLPDDLFSGRQGDSEDICDFVDSPVRLSHDECKILNF
jgi:hypothetical protein